MTALIVTAADVCELTILHRGRKALTVKKLSAYYLLTKKIYLYINRIWMAVACIAACV